MNTDLSGQNKLKNRNEIPGNNKKFLPPVYLLGALFSMGFLLFFWPVKKVILFPWNLAGLLPLLFGIMINIIADNAFKKNNTTVKPFEEPSKLVTSGVFRITRNPMYLGFTCILLGIATLTAALSVFIVPVIFAVLIDRNFIRIEEQILKKQFGKQWDDYSRKTGRWI